MNLELLLFIVLLLFVAAGVFLIVGDRAGSKAVRALEPYLIGTAADSNQEGLLSNQFSILGSLQNFLNRQKLVDSRNIENALGKSSLSNPAIVLGRMQLISTVLGLILGISIIGSNQQAIGVTQLAFLGILGLVGYLAPGQIFKKIADQKRKRILAELPVVLDFLLLSVAAGESLTQALQRISKVGSGELCSEFRRVVTLSSLGASTSSELKRMSDRIQLAELSTVIKQLLASVERGIPLADVLRELSNDLRQQQRVRLMESAAKKEIAMMVPLVFLILPVVVIFAIFPGLSALQIGF